MSVLSVNRDRRPVTCQTRVCRLLVTDASPNHGPVHTGLEPTVGCFRVGLICICKNDPLHVLVTSSLVNG